MSLIQKCSPHHFHPKRVYPNSSPNPQPFDDALIRCLKSLRASLTRSSPSVDLDFLIQSIDLLNSTLAAASALLSDPALSKPEPGSASSHLDASVALLDSLNLLTSSIDRLSLLRLHVTFALQSSSTCRARDSLTEWALNLREPSPSASFSPSDLLRSGPPRGKISAVRRAIYAVEAVSALAVGLTISSVAGADLKADLEKIRVSDEFPWSTEFNGLLTAVTEKLGGFATEIEAVDEIVEKLAAAVRGNGQMEVGVREEAERRTEELTDGLDRLGGAVNGVFRTALGLRDVVLSGFRVETRRCK